VRRAVPARQCKMLGVALRLQPAARPLVETGTTGRHPRGSEGTTCRPPRWICDTSDGATTEDGWTILTVFRGSGRYGAAQRRRGVRDRASGRSLAGAPRAARFSGHSRARQLHAAGGDGAVACAWVVSPRAAAQRGRARSACGQRSDLRRLWWRLRAGLRAYCFCQQPASHIPHAHAFTPDARARGRRYGVPHRARGRANRPPRTRRASRDARLGWSGATRSGFWGPGATHALTRRAPQAAASDTSIASRRALLGARSEDGQSRNLQGCACPGGPSRVAG
jgi:hypothetical protein